MTTDPSPDVTGFLGKILKGPIDQVMGHVLPVLERKFDEYAAKIMALLPLLVAAAVDALWQRVEARFGKFLESDPDLPVVSNIFDASEYIRARLNDETPDGINFPDLGILGGLLNRFNPGR